jgi:hypothetical protein
MDLSASRNCCKQCRRRCARRGWHVSVGGGVHVPVNLNMGMWRGLRRSALLSRYYLVWQGLDKAEIGELFANADADGSNGINFDEFVALMESTGMYSRDR